MKKQLLIGAIALGATVTTGAIITPEAQAFELYSTSLETNTGEDADPAWFSGSLTTNGDGTATFSFTNDAADDTTKVSTFYFGDDQYFDTFFDVNSDPTFSSSGGSTAYTFDWFDTSGQQIYNNNGGTWAVSSTADPNTGNNSSLVNTGETLNITFTLVDPSTTEADLLAAFLADPQQLGIAFHVQGIGDYGDSEWYQLTPGQSVPTPAAVLPILGGLFGAASRRNKKEEDDE